MSTKKAAEHFGVHVKTIQRWIRSGKLSAEMDDGRWHVLVEEHDKEHNAPNEEHEIPYGKYDAPREEHDALCDVRTLKVQLERADSEIEHLREQENHLTQVVAMSQKNIANLSEQLDSSRQMIEDMRQRRTVWQRLKAVFVAESGYG